LTFRIHGPYSAMTFFHRHPRTKVFRDKGSVTSRISQLSKVLFILSQFCFSILEHSNSWISFGVFKYAK
jgi:hypothetical protein